MNSCGCKVEREAAPHLDFIIYCPLHAAAPEMLAALKAITSNPYLHLGDLVYNIRDRELKGWEGPAVKAWSDAVMKVNAAILKAERT